MDKIRLILLWPLGLLWGITTGLRRCVFSLLSLRKKAPVTNWVIGNINVGGVGKTPMVMALITLLQENEPNLKPQSIGILSRGYGRSSRGFRWVDQGSTAQQVGDEPLEMFYNVSDGINIAVCENRVKGLNQMLIDVPSLNMVLLDDGFQHLSLEATGYIVLTHFNNSFTKDWPLPAGNLREFPAAIKYADAMIATHCDADLSLEQAEDWRHSFLSDMGRKSIGNTSKSFNSQNIYFAHYKSSTPTHYLSGKFIEPGTLVILVTGVAEPQRVAVALKSYQVIKHIVYSDHHEFDDSDIIQWRKERQQILTEKNQAVCIVTTRKDLVRIKPLLDYQGSELSLYTVYSEVQFLFGAEVNLKELLMKQ